MHNTKAYFKKHTHLTEYIDDEDLMYSAENTQLYFLTILEFELTLQPPHMWFVYIRANLYVCIGQIQEISAELKVNP